MREFISLSRRRGKEYDAAARDIVDYYEIQLSLVIQVGHFYFVARNLLPLYYLELHFMLYRKKGTNFTNKHLLTFLIRNRVSRSRNFICLRRDVKRITLLT